MKLMEVTTTQALSGEEAPKRLNIGSKGVLRRNMDVLKDAIIKFEKDEKKKKKKAKEANVLGMFAKNEN